MHPCFQGFFDQNQDSLGLLTSSLSIVTILSRHLCGPRVKICGLRKHEELAHASALGVDAVGLVFCRQSPRWISPPDAKYLLKDVAIPFVEVVALFKDAPRDLIHEVIHSVRPGCLQFHGNEAPAYCESFACDYIKAIAMQGTSTSQVTDIYTQYGSAKALLFDGHVTWGMGGVGKTFDWSMMPKIRPIPSILAGGLSIDSVQEAIWKVRPYAVDVSSGVEISRGVKDLALMEAFVQKVMQADCSVATW